VGRAHAGAVHEELQPVGRTRIGEVCGELSPVRGTSRWSRGSVRSPPPEEEGAAEPACDGLTAARVPCLAVQLQGRRGRNGSEVEPRKKGGVGESVLRSSFISHYPTLI